MKVRYCVVMSAVDGVVCVASGGRERYRLVSSVVDPICSSDLVNQKDLPEIQICLS